MSTRKTLGIGIVGLGVGEQHVHAFAAHPACSIRWLYDLSESRARDVAAQHAHAQVAARFEQLLEDSAVDVVSIASYDDAHAAQVLAALRAGKHVFVEKPLCRTMAELGPIAKAWGKSGLHLASNLVLRGAPLYIWLQAELAAGRFGKLYAFDGDYLYGRIEKITEGWRSDVADYSVMEGGGIHLIDLMLSLAGERPVKVTSAGNNICTQGTRFRYFDFQTATFAFASGLVGRITANFGCVHRHHHAVRAFGTKGTFLYDDMGARVHRTRAEDGRPDLIAHAPLPPSKGILIPDFLDAILHGRDPEPQARREFDLVSVCAAADLALKTGKPEEVRYL